LKRLRKPPFESATESKFKAKAIKLYLDGTLGACTAWMHEPFLDV